MNINREIPQTPKSDQKPKSIAFSGQNMDYNQLLKAQEERRKKYRPTIPFFDIDHSKGYPELERLQMLLRQHGLEGYFNEGLGRVMTVFIGSEEDFDKLIRFVQETGTQMKLTTLNLE